VQVKGSGLVCVGVGAQVWFAQVKGLRFGLCRCRGSGLVCGGAGARFVEVKMLGLVCVGKGAQVWFIAFLRFLIRLFPQISEQDLYTTLNFTEHYTSQFIL
jgi:hypothetical protein